MRYFSKEMVRRAVLAAAVITGTAQAATALQSLTTSPNGTIKFNASATDVTRLTVEGDRIRRVVQVSDVSTCGTDLRI